MIDDAVVLKVERLRDAVEELRSAIRARYGTAERPVTSTELRDTAAQLGERWLVEIAARDDVIQVVGGEASSNLSISFQRLITYSEQTTKRRQYETTIRSILDDFRTSVIVPLKRARYGAAASASPSTPFPLAASAEIPTVFIGQSFAPQDAEVNSAVSRLAEAYGYLVLTGEKPKADLVSKKVKERIDKAAIFIGIFTRRDRLKGRNEWAPSAWVIDEKAYAHAKKRKLILLRETGVTSIGGIQGDYEYLDFTREGIVDLLIRLLQVFRGLEG